MADRRGTRRCLAVASAALVAEVVLTACGGTSRAGPTARVASDCPAPPSPVAGSPSAAMLEPSAEPSAAAPESSAAAPELLRVQIVARLPHDPAAFTQGLAYAGGDQLYESTGRDSSARRVDLRTGRVLQRQDLESPLFGEGLAARAGEVVQLTWRDGVGIVRDRCDLRERRRFAVDGEGWGLADGGRVLWRSDGTDMLRALDPATFAVVSEVRVTDRGVPVRLLNELEVVDGSVLANVWKSDWVARIDLSSGRVTGWVDASALVRSAVASDPQVGADPEAVLNGIAWDAPGRRLWMTGKLWPVLFQVSLRRGDGALPPPGGPLA